MKIIHDHIRSKIYEDDSGRIVKIFKNKESFLKEKKAFETLSEKSIVPKYSNISEENLSITMEKLIPFIYWLNGKNDEQKYNMAFNILSSIKIMHLLSIEHNDIHAGNIVIDKYDMPKFIDFENSTIKKVNCDWNCCNDVTGHKYMGFDAIHHMSFRTLLGFKSSKIIEDIERKELIDELIFISKDKWGSKNGEGLCYGSFHHPKFHIEDAQRNTMKRFEVMGIKNFSGITTLDLGCNSGAMSTYAMMLGAISIGYEIEERLVNFNNKLSKFLNLPGKFYVKNIDEINELPKVDIIFAFAISAWVNKEHLISLLTSSGANEIYFEDNSGSDSILIPGYKSDYLGSDGGRRLYRSVKL
jgi:hypothetical protein